MLPLNTHTACLQVTMNLISYPFYSQALCRLLGRTLCVRDSHVKEANNQCHSSKEDSDPLPGDYLFLTCSSLYLEVPYINMHYSSFVYLFSEQ